MYCSIVWLAIAQPKRSIRSIVISLYRPLFFAESPICRKHSHSFNTLCSVRRVYSRQTTSNAVQIILELDSLRIKTFSSGSSSVSRHKFCEMTTTTKQELGDISSIGTVSTTAAMKRRFFIKNFSNKFFFLRYANKTWLKSEIRLSKRMSSYGLPFCWQSRVNEEIFGMGDNAHTRTRTRTHKIESKSVQNHLYIE